jgi:hypothetical protein
MGVKLHTFLTSVLDEGECSALRFARLYPPCPVHNKICESTGNQTSVEVTVVWDVAQCSVVDVYRRFGDTASIVMTLMMQHPRRQSSSYSPPRAACGPRKISVRPVT